MRINANRGMGRSQEEDIAGFYKILQYVKAGSTLSKNPD